MLFAVYVLIGLAGALGFVLLYALHPMTRNTWWRSPVGFNLMAYSVVMVLIYIQGMITRWFPTWPHGEAARAVLGLAAIVVVWWRLILLVNEIRKWKKERKEEAYVD